MPRVMDASGRTVPPDGAIAVPRFDLISTRRRQIRTQLSELRGEATSREEGPVRLRSCRSKTARPCKGDGLAVTPAHPRHGACESPDQAGGARGRAGRGVGALIESIPLFKCPTLNRFPLRRQTDLFTNTRRPTRRTSRVRLEP